ncbi:IclR family transcriptional regulator [Yersinia intermedia]|uniref:IclR family transcriptional regulator n=1 Tax=Yersinia intermedia TaxID=631 RepID=UPI000B7236E0|nr:IclR family transcriptional regulator [Yersinia intermedia]MCW8113804.1 IclR family transcriptional regulator [Yersinia intermedia]MDA5518643.1 IclR family transcriptional regulator [Yersinia intermedia]OWF88895.1 transcriptional regulator [Yersinia intermedia]
MSILASVVDVYQLFLKNGNELTVTYLVNELGMPKSSASRLLKQMADHGLLEKNKNAPIYRPGTIILEIAHRLRFAHPFIDLVLTSLNDISRDTGFTSYASVLDGDQVRVAHARLGTQMIQVVTQPGTLLPVMDTSTGRVLLTRAKPEIQNLFLSKVPTRQEWLKQELEQIHKQGWASSINEFVSGVASVSSAVYDPIRDESIALCLSMPAAQVNDEFVKKLAGIVYAHASKIGSSVGDPYWFDR